MEPESQRIINRGTIVPFFLSFFFFFSPPNPRDETSVRSTCDSVRTSAKIRPLAPNYDTAVPTHLTQSVPGVTRCRSVFGVAPAEAVTVGKINIINYLLCEKQKKQNKHRTEE